MTDSCRNAFKQTGLFFRKFMIVVCLSGLLAGVPSRAHAVFPVTDIGLTALFLGYYTYLMTVQWPAENSERSRNTEALGALQQMAIKANTAAQQSNIDMQSRMVNASSTDETARKHYYTTGNKLCPLIKAADAENEAADASSALVDALNETIRWIGVSGDNPNWSYQLFKTMCDMNLMPTVQAKSLIDQYCKMTINGYQGKVMHANSVVGNIEYKFPSNIRKGAKAKTLVLEKPQDEEDMPGLTAIFYCVLSHPISARPSGSDSRSEATASDINQIMVQMSQQAANNPSGDLCMSAVAERLAIPSSAPDTLKRFHDAQEKYCLYMHKAHCMSDKDYSDCKKYGMSALNRRRHNACQMGLPNCVIKGRAARGFGALDVTREVMNGSQSCSSFWNEVNENKLKFINNMNSTARTNAGGYSPNPTARPGGN